ncbi:MAG: GAF domain-containing protein [Ardenticatenaceae bacterium]|nr:GAF domain-containing protein [Ardenticatenaceae bacterium]
MYVLLPIQAQRWATTPFAGFLLDPNLVVSDTGKSDWLAELDPPLAYPERLIALNHTPLPSNRAFYALLATKQVGDQVTLTFEQPHNSRITEGTSPAQRTITATLTQFDANSLWRQFWLLYSVGLIILVIGAWAFFIRPRLEAAQTFALFAAAGSLAAGLLFDLITTQTFTRIWLTALSLVGTLNLYVALIYPHKAHLTERYPLLKWLLLLPGLFICFWGQYWLFSTSDAWAYVAPWRMAYLLNGVALLAVWGLMAYRGFGSRSPFVQQQGRFILASALLGFAPLTFFFLTGSRGLHFDWLVVELYVPPVILYPLTIGYLIIHHRLMDVNEALRRGMAYGLLLTLLLGGIILIVSGLGTVFNTAHPVFLAVLIVIVTVIFSPLRDGIQRELDRMLFRKPARLNELLREYNRELKTAVTTTQVQQILLKYIEDGLPETRPQLFLPDSETRCFINGNGSLIEMDSPFVQAIRLQSGVLDLTEERSWPAELHGYRETVYKMNTAVLVPMTNEHDLLGWLSLSPKQSQQNFSQGELSYLEDLADQSLIGLERANVIERLEARVGELDTLNQFSQLLNFTPKADAVLELVYAHYQRLFDVQNFYVSLWDEKEQELYTAYFVENGRRREEREGRRQLTHHPLLHEAVDTGQTVVDWEGNQFWIVAPLNAGLRALGTIHATYVNKALSRRQAELFEVFTDRTAVALDRLQTQAQLETRAQQLETINQIALSLTSTIKVEPLLNLILDKAIELLTAEAGTFLLVDQDSGELEFSVVRGPASDELLGTRLPIGKGLAGAAARTGQPILTNHAQEDKRHFTEVDKATEFVTRSILTVPLVLQNHVMGVLQIINKQDGAAFDESDQQLLLGFGSQAVVALENARLLAQTDEALQERVNELFMLQQLDRELNTTLNPNEVLAITLDWALRICGGTAGAIILADEEGTPTTRAVRGYDNNLKISPIGPESHKVGLIGQVLANGKPHLTGNVQEEPNYVEASSLTRSQLTLPIIHQQKTLGAMAIESDQADAFDPATAETAVRVTNHAAAAIANALLYAQVNEANQAKSEFVSMVSHELKTPMTSMRGYTDLLLSGMMGELSEQQRKFLEIIAQNIQRMSRQVQDLTDISRIESGRLHMTFAPTAFTNVVSETLPSVQGLSDEKGIKLTLDIPAELPLVQGDKERLVQVLTNLISNAIKYSPAHTEVLVRFETAVLPSPHQPNAQPMVVCAVQDQGYGISAEDQQKLFTKFFRADDPNIRQAKGTGLGLSITKGIIELHGGHIWLESDLGQGTTFFFAIPQSLEA